ncbi:hypothetical protein BDV06DRAFT_213967 [Aspergillus oleicola]
MHLKKAKLPVRQLTILSICRFAEPIAVTSFLPYLPEMIEGVGVHESEVAKWAGITTAVSSFAQAGMAVHWGRASDKFGRKPIILLGLTATMIFSLAFGLSQHLWMVIACRGIVGLMNGNVGIIRTMVAEMVQDKELQPKAFSIMPMIWTIGSIFGPSLGGSLARPAEKYPEVFGGSRLLREYPFFLPNLVTCLFFVIGISTGWLFLHETLAAKQGHRDPGIVLGRLITRPCTGGREKASRKGLDGEEAPLLGERRPPPKVEVKRHGWREVLGPQSTLILLTYTLMSVHTMAFESLIPVFLHTPPQQVNGNPDVDLPFKFVGGSGMDAQRIGLFYTITGIVGIVVQFYLFPTFARRFGVLNCVKTSAAIFPLIYFFTPYVSLIPGGLPRNLAIGLLIGSKLTVSIFNFPGITILLTNSAKSLSVLGTLNGVATSVSALGRAAGPALLGPIFSLGVRAGYIIVPWWFLSFLAVVSAVPTWFIVEGEGFASSSSGAESEEDEDEDEEDPIKYNDQGR